MESGQQSRTMEASPNCLKLTRYFFPASERSDSDVIEQIAQASILVQDIVAKELLPHQFDALVCLASDIVAGLLSFSEEEFQDSFLLSAVNLGMFQVAAAEFHTFCYTDGRLSRRAWEKRRAEQYLFLRGELMFD